ncbi:hypothetical protein PV328_009043 [Microctonus aethiopoides]|uniref:Aminoacyl-transfer RNA synthetases class-II family profile domain-containing protein n=1 Tax=Microctonus aethiopoides TaxID=144406 RepID=A0AA39KRV8_9HYME|nr:hypothetical protein PV328_009043 [Microctonus aethiopoides]
MLAKSRILFFQRCSRAIANEFYLAGKNSKNVIDDNKCLVAHYSQNTLQVTRRNVEETLPVNKYVHRSHTCGELGVNNIGEIVQLCGWMEYQRMGKFITLRDSYGTTQLIIPDDKHALIKEVERLNYESILSVIGKVIARPSGQENHSMTTGIIEILVDDLEILNDAVSQLPFYNRQHNVPKETLQMQYRYLALRFPTMQRNLRIRSQLIHRMRNYLIDHCGFVDVETPTLFRRTPGGAQEFIVPTKHPGKFYSLVQSPQQFKQLLMIGGIDRYFQIARCYRDETGRPDRQPEFTQLDIEMSFTDTEGMINLVEGLLEHSWPKQLGRLKLPIQRLKYEDVMEIYGTDQPDLRIPYRIFNVTESYADLSHNDDSMSVYALSVPDGSEFLTKSVKDQLSNMGKNYFTRAKLLQFKAGNDTIITKLEQVGINMPMITRRLKLKEKDALFVAYGEKNDARKLIGKIRTEFVNIMESKNQKIRSPDYKFAWITDFPLFEKGENEGELKSTHHPFTAIHPEDIEYLKTDPLKIRGLHYDLVLNGSEIAGGSIRIHNAILQEKILDMLNINKSEMKHLLEALASGAPPHGGIAFGMDRLISIICDSSSIRNVIAFPKTMEGRDLMSGAPAEISKEEYKMYHLNALNNTKNNKK